MFWSVKNSNQNRWERFVIQNFFATKIMTNSRLLLWRLSSNSQVKITLDKVEHTLSIPRVYMIERLKNLIHLKFGIQKQDFEIKQFGKMDFFLLYFFVFWNHISVLEIFKYVKNFFNTVDDKFSIQQGNLHFNIQWLFRILEKRFFFVFEWICDAKKTQKNHFGISKLLKNSSSSTASSKKNEQKEAERHLTSQSPKPTFDKFQDFE